jgi:hypothetical protein
MNNEPVAWMDKETGCFVYSRYDYEDLDEYGKDGLIPLYTHPVKTLTDEEIAKVVHELNQKANTPDRWVTAMEIGAATIIQLRDELAILKKAQEQ